MIPLGGPISDRLRERCERDDPAWTPQRPADVGNTTVDVAQIVRARRQEDQR